MQSFAVDVPHMPGAAQPDATPQGTPQGSVLVRVLEPRGGGSYLVSFGGGRLVVQSERPLAAGQSFMAAVRAQDGRLLLTPVSDGTAPQTLAESLGAQLEQLGIPQDGAGAFLTQFIQQGGMKLDAPLMKKALAIAARFPDKQKKAAEAAMLLLEHGIEPTDDVVAALLMLLDGGAGNGAPGGGTTDQQTDDDADGSGQGFLRSVYDAASVQRLGGSPAGLLALVNQMSRGNRHWVFLPYTWSSGGGTAGGMIRLLVDTERQVTARMVLDVSPQGAALDGRYFFVLYYEAGEPSRLDFCAQPDLPASAAASAEQTLASTVAGQLGRAVTVRYDRSAALEGLCTTAQKPRSIGGAFA